MWFKKKDLKVVRISNHNGAVSDIDMMSPFLYCILQSGPRELGMAGTGGDTASQPGSPAGAT